MGIPPDRQHLSRLIIAPVSVAICLLMLLFFLFASIITLRNLQTAVHDRVVTIDESFKQLIQLETDKLKALAESLIANQELAQAFARKDRDALLRGSTHLFDTLREAHRVTHYYYHNTDATNFLRVHHPPKFGDVIDRHTLRTARQDDNVAFGIELGVLGSYTLRLVKPWQHEGNLIGYVELGMEIDHLFEQLHRISHTSLAVTLYKNRLRRENWLQGNAIFGRVSDWDRFPDKLLLATFGGFDDSVVHRNDMRLSAWGYLTGAGLVYRTLTIRDVKQRRIGELYLGFDTSDIAGRTLTAVAYLAVIVILSFVSLVAFLHVVIKRVETRLRTAMTERADFERRSKYDQMTNVYNKEEFYRLLELELQRSKRQHTPLSLILLDIDFFKDINDEHGHQTGDCVLRGVARELMDNMRDGDHLARFGGEEFTLILPDTELDDALEIADRWRAVIHKSLFQCQGRSVKITISLGIANYPLHGYTPRALLQNADMAMYAAKRKGRNRSEVFVAR